MPLGPVCRRAALALSLTWALAPATSYADEPTQQELAAARALFVEAKELEAKDRWADALERFEKVGKIKMTPQVRFHIALCQENLGRWVDAINGFELAAQEAQKMGKKAAEVAENAPPRAENLRARVAQLTFEVEGTVRSSKIFIDDDEVSVALAGTPIPLDPGEHVLEVRRGDEVIDSRSLSLEEAGTETIQLTIDDPLPPDPEPIDAMPQPITDPGSDPRPTGDGVGRWPAYVVGAVGAAGIVAGGVLWALREDAVGSVRCADPDNFVGCNPADRSLADQGQSYDLGSKIAFGAGGGLLAAGVVLFFVLAPDDESPAPGAAQIELAPYADGGFQLRGRF